LHNGGVNMQTDIYQVWMIDGNGDDRFAHFTDRGVAKELRDELKKSEKINNVVVNEFRLRPINKPADEEAKDILKDIKLD